MSKRHGAREQKKLSKQQAKREQRRKQLARQSSPNPMIRLKEAYRWPVVAAMIPESLWELGIGSLLLARRMPDGMLACGLFLLDVFALGVKDASWRITYREELDTLIDDLEEHSGEKLQEVSPECFAKLVHSAVDYAHSLGIAPHRDFRHAALLLAGIDSSSCREQFTFGREGLPMYVSGPNDSPQLGRALSARMNEAGGNFILRIEGGELPGPANFDSVPDKPGVAMHADHAGGADNHVIDV